MYKEKLFFTILHQMQKKVKYQKTDQLFKKII